MKMLISLLMKLSRNVLAEMVEGYFDYLFVLNTLLGAIS